MTTKSIWSENTLFLYIIATDNFANSCTEVFTIYWRFLLYTWKLSMSQGLAFSQTLNYDVRWLSNWLSNHTEKVSAATSVLESWRQVPGNCFFLCFDQVCNSWQHCTVSGFSVLPIDRMGAFNLLLQKGI